MKKCSTSLVTTEIQIKTTMRNKLNTENIMRNKIDMETKLIMFTRWEGDWENIERGEGIKKCKMDSYE